MEPNSVKFDPIFGDDWKPIGRKMLIVFSIMIVSAVTLSALKSIFHPPDSIDFDYSWICGFQFMLLFLGGDQLMGLKTTRLILFATIIAITTTAIFFTSDFLQ
jgi:hypothetical protein